MKKLLYLTLLFLFAAGLGTYALKLEARDNFPIKKIEHNFQINENSTATLHLYQFSPQSYDFHLIHSNEPKKIKNWFLDNEEFHLVINAMYFHEDQLPAGYFVSHNQRIGEFQFDLDKTGLINFTPNFQIIDTSSQPVNLQEFETAAQSYPFFIKNGKSAIKEDSGLTARRSFIGTDMDGNIYVGVLTKASISLYQLMNTLQEMDIAWDKVINLDGGPSTGIAVRFPDHNEIFNSITTIPNIIAITPKK